MKTKFNELTSEQIREVMDRQVFLENFTDPEYDSFTKNQTISEWWKKNLWYTLSFEVIDLD
jgi:hypothetical protein